MQNLLNLADIVERTCPVGTNAAAWRSYLLRVLEEPETRDLLQGEKHPLYPEGVLPFFCRIADLRAKGFKPKAISAQIRLSQEDPALIPQPDTGYPKSGQSAGRQSSGSEIMVLPQHAADLLAQLVERIGDRAADRLAEHLLPPPEDRLIGAEEAAVLLCCAPRSVGRLLRRGDVAPVRPGVWKRGQVLRYIQAL